ncbi:lipopolysaccharide ABC superfamily ATP binding cassette transporter, ABC domain protein [Mycobacterium xenopi 4042]|uniref:Lipopolysaccharide ABC superfamily ATP binding cassette transporter, ABC domain protein n=1 Tax=Mycobacterium xenopi 4042 TaxID=1299334 RepID=X7ZJE2_MYCXE|nr:lipopolysaccharide ABC superfamily ATP binding cassette transporter, ABC domain protein [Mycobacterium xenopi 4042]
MDADFLKKAQPRLQRLVERSGILVFASHSNEFLAGCARPRCGSSTAASG